MMKQVAEMRMQYAMCECVKCIPSTDDQIDIKQFHAFPFSK